MVMNVRSICAIPCHRARRGLACLSLASSALAGVCGCSSIPWCGDDPAEKFPDDQCGFFVSSSLGDDSNEGSRARPLKTLREAGVRADPGEWRIFACAEVFEEPLILSGVDLWGGFDCANGWTYRGSEARTVFATVEPSENRVRGDYRRGAMLANVRIVAPDEIIRLDTFGVTLTDPVLRVNSRENPVRILGSQIVAGNNLGPGSGSVALDIDGNDRPESTVEIVDSEVIAKDAGAGPPWGITETVHGSGEDGKRGGSTCSSDRTPGAPAVTITFVGDASTGGRGGDGLLSHGEPGADGQPIVMPNPTGTGLGGLGQRDTACTDGHSGARGADGDYGPGGKKPISIHLPFFNGIFLPMNWGSPGARGRMGQGGGGGGGSRGGERTCAPGPLGGASGGSGGSGGYGGRYGHGGGPGGFSVGIHLRGGKLILRRTSIQTGHGGHGGDGGPGFAGTPGGLGGDGGSGAKGVLPGCRGGDGGHGGTGGPGGGGMGGSSIRILYQDTLVLNPDDIDATFIPGTPGKGGLGGDPTILESNGDDGVDVDFMPYESDDPSDNR
jgi:hypothetical protein